MVDTISLEVPEQEQTRSTIRRYFRFYLDEMDEYENAPIEELHDYRQVIERFEEKDKFMIYYQLLTPVAEKIVPPVPEIWNRYADDENGLSEVMNSPIGIAKFGQACENARESTTELYEGKRLDELITLASFAIENGYGLVYP